MDIRFIDLFGGIGGFRRGIENATNGSWECVWYNDVDKYCNQVYNKRFGENYEPEDIRNIKAKEIPGHDLICGGFPCQSFSIAGKRGGMVFDVRGNLFWEILKIAKAKRTKYILLENVKGLLSSNNGTDFAAIIYALQDMGYAVEWQVLNSKDFGVPQNRERVFIIGHLGGFGGKQVFPIRENDKIIDEGDKGEGKEGFGVQSEVSPTIDGGYGKFRNAGEPYIVHNIYGGFGEDVRIYDDVVPTIPTPFGGGHIPCIISRYPRWGDPNKGGTGLLINQEYSFTVDSIPHNLIKEGDVRKLTPVECERLQGFTDNWTEGFSDMRRYKMIGNAVTVNVIKAITKKWMEVLS